MFSRKGGVWLKGACFERGHSSQFFTLTRNENNKNVKFHSIFFLIFNLWIDFGIATYLKNGLRESCFPRISLVDFRIANNLKTDAATVGVL